MNQTPGRIRALLEKYEIQPRKSLGQHFLADPNVTSKIVDLIPPEGLTVEVGAGTGALTTALAERGHQVVAYEKDSRLRPLLAEVLSGIAGVEIRFADVMTIDLAADVGADDWILAGNLPYNIATPLILDVLRDAPTAHYMAVMVQLEVAQRLVSAPGSKSYGVPSVVAQLYGDPTLEFRVPAQLFVPPPGVASAVITIRRYSRTRPFAGRAADLASTAFRQRRKMIRSSLATVVPDLQQVLAMAAIDDDLRADALSPEDYLAIAEAEAA